MDDNQTTDQEPSDFRKRELKKHPEVMVAKGLPDEELWNVESTIDMRRRKTWIRHKLGRDENIWKRNIEADLAGNKSHGEEESEGQNSLVAYAPFSSYSTRDQLRSCFPE